MHRVYRLSKTPVQSNAYGVCREEIWSVVEDKEFATQEEAERYVINKNFRFCSYDLAIFANDPPEVIRARCLTDPEWEFAREYFTHKPSIPLLKKQLREHHIKVAERNKELFGMTTHGNDASTSTTTL